MYRKIQLGFLNVGKEIQDDFFVRHQLIISEVLQKPEIFMLQVLCTSFGCLVLVSG